MSAALLPTAVRAQSDAPPIRPLRTSPTEGLSVNAGVRDWGPATIAGATILAGGPTGRGGLFAVDLQTGKLKWTYRPGTMSGSVSTSPAIFRDLAIAPFGAANPGAVVAVSITSGKEVWRGPDPAAGAAVAVHGDLAFVQGKDGNFYALEAATGRERWKAAFSTRRAECASRPIARDDTIYLTVSAEAIPGDAAKPAGYYLLALDAKTGQERWRYRAEAPYVHPGVCLRQPVVTAATIFASGDTWLYAVDRATGKERWKQEVRRPVEGRNRLVEVHGLVDAGAVLIGITGTSLLAFDMGSGRIAWDIPGEYSTSNPATAVAGNILYFQGSPGSRPAAASRGTLHALDLESHTIPLVVQPAHRRAQLAVRVGDPGEWRHLGEFLPGTGEAAMKSPENGVHAWNGHLRFRASRG